MLKRRGFGGAHGFRSSVQLTAVRRLVLTGALLGLLPACAPTGQSVRGPRPVREAEAAVRAALLVESSINPTTFPEASIGVAPFQVVAQDTALNVLGHGLAALLMTDLAKSRQVQVVDRLRIDAFLREQKLTASGVIDSSSAPRMGRILGARQIISGAVVAPTRGNIRLDGQIGDVVTGTIRAVPASPTSLDAILDAEKALAFAIFDRLGVTLSPTERTAIEQRPTRNLGALLAYSRGVRAELQGDFGTAQREYRAAARRDRGFTQAADRGKQLGGDVGANSGAGATDLALEGISPRSPSTRTGTGVQDPSLPTKVSIIIIVNLP